MKPDELAAIEAAARAAIGPGATSYWNTEYDARPEAVLELIAAYREALQVIRGQRNLIDALTGEPPEHLVS